MTKALWFSKLTHFARTSKKTVSRWAPALPSLLFLFHIRQNPSIVKVVFVSLNILNTYQNQALSSLVSLIAILVWWISPGINLTALLCSLFIESWYVLVFQLPPSIPEGKVHQTALFAMQRSFWHQVHGTLRSNKPLEIIMKMIPLWLHWRSRSLSEGNLCTRWLTWNTYVSQVFWGSEIIPIIWVDEKIF